MCPLESFSYHHEWLLDNMIRQTVHKSKFLGLIGGPSVNSIMIILMMSKEYEIREKNGLRVLNHTDLRLVKDMRQT